MEDNTDNIFNELEDSIEDLINMLNVSGDILTYNLEVEDTIVKNGGTVLYSYNNIIIASEISDQLYSELEKSHHVEFIQSLPLKKYGEIDYSLIDQIII